MLNAVKMGDGTEANAHAGSAVVYKLRDYNQHMVTAWEHSFASYPDSVQISHGDIFKGAPSADAIVSPANSFGFMDGGIDLVYSRHFGWQMMHRLQEEIISQKDGELLVMLLAYETFELGLNKDRREPKQLHEVSVDEHDMKLAWEDMPDEKNLLTE